MSRHLFDADLHGNPIRVTVGYDRPTNSFFLIIGWIDPQTNSVFDYAYDLKLAYDPHDWRSIRRFLETLAVSAPESVWTEVAHDATVRSGCRVARHFNDGTMRVLLNT